MPIADFNLSKLLAPMSGAPSQVGAIPIRWIDGRPEILLITTRGTGRWSVPKGWPLAESLGAECAAREAFEEAGVRGRIEPYALGTFDYWKRSKKDRVILQVSAFVLHVEEMAMDWPERRERKRAWFAPDVACRLVNNDELSVLMKAALQVQPLVSWPARPAVRAT